MLSSPCLTFAKHCALQAFLPDLCHLFYTGAITQSVYDQICRRLYMIKRNKIAACDAVFLYIMLNIFCTCTVAVRVTNIKYTTCTWYFCLVKLWRCPCVRFLHSCFSEACNGKSAKFDGEKYFQHRATKENISIKMKISVMLCHDWTIAPFSNLKIVFLSPSTCKISSSLIFGTSIWKMKLAVIKLLEILLRDF